ncbi:MAG: hypothetical protein QMD86_00575 [Patescibacteria group bacterium]|nr:hypothetical protein [Patescibacteria group bacterium]
MDIFSHGLWAGAAYKALRQKQIQYKNKNLLKPLQAAFWGIFPDIFSFTPVFIWLFGNLVLGTIDFQNLPKPDGIEPAQKDTLPIFRLTSMLYNASHSIIIFLIVFGFALIIKRILFSENQIMTWEMGAWLFHISIDIPTHSYQFYPTPFLWPISDWKFNGFSWGTPWFMIINYSALAVVYIILSKKISVKNRQ